MIDMSLGEVQKEKRLSIEPWHPPPCGGQGDQAEPARKQRIEAGEMAGTRREVAFLESQDGGCADRLRKD